MVEAFYRQRTELKMESNFRFSYIQLNTHSIDTNFRLQMLVGGLRGHFQMVGNTRGMHAMHAKPRQKLMVIYHLYT